MKMPSLRVNINKEIKEKERNVHFSKFNKNNNGIENKNNEHDNDINDNIYTKENVNNFIIKKEYFINLKKIKTQEEMKMNN